MFVLEVRAGVTELPCISAGPRGFRTLAPEGQPLCPPCARRSTPCRAQPTISRGRSRWRKC